MARNAAALVDNLAATEVIASSRTDNPRETNAKRKQTLLSLLDALNELSKDEVIDGGDNAQANFEDDQDVPSVDEHHQQVGAEAFHRFQRRVDHLDTELRNFSNAARQLGSSVGILSSAYHLRERFTHLLHLFRENAACLFPRKVARQARDAPLPMARMPAGGRKIKRPPSHVARPQTRFDAEDLDPEAFPEELQHLAREVMTLLNCLNEFPEFSDEAVNTSIQSFEGDLKYWSSCLRAYEGQFKYPAVQRYLHDLTVEMGDHLDSITTSLAYFTEVGVPTIRFGQQHGAANLQNLSTVSTLFSAVTATTIQFSFEMTDTRLSSAVNAFWFSSLVFSIASAVNSLLGLTWKQAMYRSPRHRVPWWVLIWIKRSPLVFLVISVASFSIGLVLFAYSSNQSHVTSTITTVFTSFSSFGLVAVSVWFASERRAFIRHRGQKWLADVLDDFNHQMADSRHRGQKWLTDMFDNLNHRMANSRPFVWCRRASHTLAESSKTRLRRSNSVLSHAGLRMRTSVSDMFHAGRIMTDSHSSRDLLPTVAPSAHEPLTSPPLSDAGTIRQAYEKPPGSPEVPMPTEPTLPAAPQTRAGQGRFASLVRSAVIMIRATEQISAVPVRSPTRQGTASSSILIPDGGPTKDLGSSGGVKASRLTTLAPRLKSLEATQDLAAHQALVKHLQFSPDGKFLATSSWDRTSVIFRVGEPFQQWRILAHPQGFVGQVAWSPSGKLLMTKLNRGIKLWTEDGVCKKTIDRGETVQSITWLANGKTFLSVEGNTVVKLDLVGKIHGTYSFDRMKLHDVAVTPDGRRLLGVGTLLESADGFLPSKSRAEKRIVVYNMENEKIESQVPVLNEVRDITMARSGKVVLVSYENKAPPQLWKLDMLKDREDPTDITSRLTLRHTYMPKVIVDFAGTSYFGGKDDELVLCASKGGDIHIWHRESGAQLHHIRAQALGGDLTCVAWNPAADDPFMFATGSHDGGVRIWSTPPKTSSTDTRDADIPRGHSPRAAPMIPPAHNPGPTTPRRPPAPLAPVPPSMNTGLSLDLGWRTDSPVMQDEPGSLHDIAEEGTIDDASRSPPRT